MKILIGISGSIAIYKSCELIRELNKMGHSIFVGMTKTATEWINPLIFETLSGNLVYTNNYNQNLTSSMSHIDIRDSLDLIVIAPATANIIAKAANGIADDFLTTTLLTFAGERWFAPAMNPNMWTHPAVQKNIKQLKEYGYKIIQPATGEAICGDIGQGKMAEIKMIIDEINLFFK